MSDDLSLSGARLVGRLVTVEEYDRLCEIGVLGEQVELIEGRIVCGRYPFALSDDAFAAAGADGIELHPTERGTTYTLASLGTPPPEASDRQSERQAWQRAGPNSEPARTLAARRAWVTLEPAVLALIEESGADLERAVRWLAATNEDLDGASPAGWIASGRDPQRVLSLAASAAEHLPSAAAGAPIDPSVIEAISALALRLGRVMRSEYIPTWLYRSGIEGLGSDRPIDLIGRGDISTVARVVSALEDPGAT